MLDTNIVLHQMDVLVAAGPALCDVVVLSTVAAEVRHRNATAYSRLAQLLQEPGRRFVPFANEHHREAHVERARGETPNDYNDRAIRAATEWLARHWADAGLRVLLLTDDRASAAAARADGLNVASTREFVSTLADVAPGLGELVAAEEASARGADSEAATAASRGGDDGLEEGGSGVGAGGAVYREHWTPARAAAAVKARRAFQGTLRVNRECWFEARVAVHGVVSGRSDTRARGADVVSVLVLGHDAMNRAMEGDVVIVELLPVSQWSAPAGRLADHAAVRGGADAEDKEERVTLAQAQQQQPATDAAGAGEGAEASGGAAAAAVVATSAAAPETTAIEVDAEEDDVVVASSNSAASSASEAPSAVAPNDASAVAVLRDEAVKAKARGIMPTARVVSIVRRGWRAYCGSLEVEEVETAALGAGATAAATNGSSSSLLQLPDGGAAATPVLFVPVDPRIPRIRIDTRQRSALSDKRLVVAVDGWDVTSRFPRGHYVRTLGPVGDKATETEVILLEHDVAARPFSSDVLACLPPANWAITPANSIGRTDLRGVEDVCVCSVDPPGWVEMMW